MKRDFVLFHTPYSEMSENPSKGIGENRGKSFKREKKGNLTGNDKFPPTRISLFFY